MFQDGSSVVQPTTVADAAVVCVLAAFRGAPHDFTASHAMACGHLSVTQEADGSYILSQQVIPK